MFETFSANFEPFVLKWEGMGGGGGKGEYRVLKKLTQW